MSKKGQVSFEYLIIVGFALVSVLGIGIFAFYSYQSFSDEIIIKQAQKAANQLVNGAELVYAYGEPTYVTQQIFVPQNTELIVVSANEVTFRIQTSRGFTDVTSYATINMSGTISPTIGTKNIVISAGETNATLA